MTTMKMPKFINSKYFVPEFNNWHLTSDAPPEIVNEFNKWMNEYNNTEIGKINKNNNNDDNLSQP